MLNKSKLDYEKEEKNVEELRASEVGCNLMLFFLSFLVRLSIVDLTASIW